MQCLVCRVGEAERRLPSINSIGRVKAITDTFGNQVAVDNQQEKEDLHGNPEIDISNEDEGKSCN
jgi:hypothetical protein